jgi:hypothetical protein
LKETLQEGIVHEKCLRQTCWFRATQLGNSSLSFFGASAYCFRVNVWRIDEIVQEVEQNENQGFGKSLQGVYYFSIFIVWLLERGILAQPSLNLFNIFYYTK